MKLNMSQAWSDAVATLNANREVVVAVAGVFFFLPYLALMLFLPAEMAELQGGSANPDPEAMGQMLVDFYSSFWWVFLLIGVAQGIGTLSLMALLTDRARPTLGEALRIGAMMFLPFLVAQLLVGFAMGALIVLPIAIGAAAGSVPVGVLLALVALPAVAYFYTKFSLSSPVFAVERTMNPIAALRRSWRLTKGNSLMLFLFYVLLILAIAVVGLIVTMVTGVVFALMSGDIALIGNGFVASLVNAVSATLMAAVLVAVYRQLSGGSRAELNETFE